MTDLEVQQENEIKLLKAKIQKMKEGMIGLLGEINHTLDCNTISYAESECDCGIQMLITKFGVKELIEDVL